MKRKTRVTKRAKKTYRPPRLVVHGDIHALTKVKRGSRSDGSGKPATRASGPNT